LIKSTNSVNKLTELTSFIIEIKDEQITAVDFKWGNQKKKIPAFFAKNYSEASFKVINKENYLDFVS